MIKPLQVGILSIAGRRVKVRFPQPGRAFFIAIFSSPLQGGSRDVYSHHKLNITLLLKSGILVQLSNAVESCQIPYALC
jgi:hypothetical protein